MTETPPTARTGQELIDHLLDHLSRHPKRVVFTEGEDIRVLRAAARLIERRVIAPVLLGNRDRIRALAASHSVSTRSIHVIDPREASDFDLFCRRLETISRYRGTLPGNLAEIVARPHTFGALMVQYGQADAIVGGNQALPAAFFRALLHTIKPRPEVPRIFGLSILIGPHLRNLGGPGMLLLADTALIPTPEVGELAAIAIESGKLAQHFLGRRPVVAMLSHSTHGSSSTPDALRVAAATSLAKDRVMREFLDIGIEGEVQADVALDAEAAEIKIPGALRRPAADVLVFPNLDAAHLSLDLLRHIAGAQHYGQLIVGLARPAARLSRVASVETIFGTAVAVAVEAIKYHQLHPESDF